MKNIAQTIEEMKKQMNAETRDFVYDYYNSNSNYISDSIHEFADGRTSIYYSDIIKFISENVEAVNDAIDEFGWEGCGSSLYSAGQMAEYIQIQNKIYEDDEYILRLSALLLLKDQGILSVDEDLLDQWLDEIENNMDTGDGFNDLEDILNQCLADFAESCEEEPERENLIKKVA